MASRKYERLAGHDPSEEQPSEATPSSYGPPLSSRRSSTSTLPHSPHLQTISSRPPSFHSRNSSSSSPSQLNHANSRHHNHRFAATFDHQSEMTEAQRTLAMTFDNGSDTEGDDDPVSTSDQSRHHLLSSSSVQTSRQPEGPQILLQNTRSALNRTDNRLTHISNSPPPLDSHAANLNSTLSSQPPNGASQDFQRTYPASSLPPGGAVSLSTSAPFSQFSSSNDGVFANLNAKPEHGEKVEDQLPPSYEFAAADATPPYWETTILAPGQFTGSDEIYVDGLPVGTVFSFAWNALISMSFQLVGFLLTYLLHTTHAAKNGSRAGLGITLVQYGFYMRSGSRRTGDLSSPPGLASPTSGSDASADLGDMGIPADPNAHLGFQSTATLSSSSTDAASAAATSMSSIPVMQENMHGHGSLSGFGSSIGISGSRDWIAYGLMIIGWFILIRAVSNFYRARRHEALVLQGPATENLVIPTISSILPTSEPVLESGEPTHNGLANHTNSNPPIISSNSEGRHHESV